MVRYNFDAKSSFNLMDYKKQLVVGSAVLSILGMGYNVLKPSKIEQNNNNLIQTAEVQANINPVQNTQIQTSQNPAQVPTNNQLSGLEERLNSMEEIVGTYEKDKTTGKPLVYRIDMNFDGNTEEVKVTTSKFSNYNVHYINQKPQNVTLDLPYVGENIISKYFINPDTNVIQIIKKNPQMVCELKDYAQKLGIWTTSTDSVFTPSYAKLYSTAGNPKCE